MQVSTVKDETGSIAQLSIISERYIRISWTILNWVKIKTNTICKSKQVIARINQVRFTFVGCFALHD